MSAAEPARNFQAGVRLTFGCHDFLNSQPVIYPIKKGLVAAPFDTVFAPPGELADRLRAGGLDLAFIPAIEYARIHGLRIVPGFSIAAKGPVKTVLLFSRRPIEEIEAVAVDRRSRTSVSLLRLLMKEFYGREPEFAVTPDVHSLLEAPRDAALVIGDEAFRDAKGHHVYDLSELWYRFTGKPFVFALLCVAPGREAGPAIEALRTALRKGKGMVEEICRDCAPRVGISHEACMDYLQNTIRYDLAEEDREGLKLFLELAHKHQLAHGFTPPVYYPL